MSSAHGNLFQRMDRTRPSPPPPFVTNKRVTKITLSKHWVIGSEQVSDDRRRSHLKRDKHKPGLIQHKHIVSIGVNYLAGSFTGPPCIFLHPAELMELALAAYTSLRPVGE